MGGGDVLGDEGILCGGVNLGGRVICEVETFWVAESIWGTETFCVADSF